MAMKVALAVALLVAMVALATAMHTTYTSTFIEEENYGQQCSQQVRRRQFLPCQRFLQQRSNGGEEEEETAINDQQQYLQECCQQLRAMDRQQCGCEAIRHTMREAQLRLGGRSYETAGQSEQIYQRARALPRRCNLRHQQCRFNLLFV